MNHRLLRSKALRLASFATILALVFAAGSVFVALGDSSATTYYACLKDNGLLVDGTLSNVGTQPPSKCPGNSTVISWNQQGPQGIPGPAGPQGLQGDTGPQGAQGAPGDAGQQGAVGPAGETGPQGPAGSAGLSGYEVVEVTGPVGNPFQEREALKLTCSGDRKVLSVGGYPVQDSGITGIVDRIAIHAIIPVNDNTWVIQMINPNPDGITTWHLVGYAVCANATP